MTRGEIIANYRQAKDPKRQRRILAELNLCSIAEIDQILHIAKSTIKEEKSLKPKINEAEALRLYNEGKGDAEIAEVFGVTPGGIWHWRKSRGLKNVKKEETPVPLKVPSIDALPAEVKEKVQTALAQKEAPEPPQVNKPISLPAPNKYDPQIYDAFEQAREYAQEAGINMSLVWRKLQKAVETHIVALAPYLIVSEEACCYAVRLAAVASAEEVCSAEK